LLLMTIYNTDRRQRREDDQQGRCPLTHHCVLHEFRRRLPRPPLVLHLRRLHLRRLGEYVVQVPLGRRRLLSPLLLLSLVVICRADTERGSIIFLEPQKRTKSKKAKCPPVDVDGGWRLHAPLSTSSMRAIVVVSPAWWLYSAASFCLWLSVCRVKWKDRAKSFAGALSCADELCCHFFWCDKVATLGIS
jgi:hypothetical protein